MTDILGVGYENKGVEKYREFSDPKLKKESEKFISDLMKDSNINKKDLEKKVLSFLDKYKKNPKLFSEIKQKLFLRLQKEIKNQRAALNASVSTADATTADKVSKLYVLANIVKDTVLEDDKLLLKNAINDCYKPKTADAPAMPGEQGADLAVDKASDESADQKELNKIEVKPDPHGYHWNYDNVIKRYEDIQKKSDNPSELTLIDSSRLPVWIEHATSLQEQIKETDKYEKNNQTFVTAYNRLSTYMEETKKMKTTVFSYENILKKSYVPYFKNKYDEVINMKNKPLSEILNAAESCYNDIDRSQIYNVLNDQERNDPKIKPYIDTIEKYRDDLKMLCKNLETNKPGNTIIENPADYLKSSSTANTADWAEENSKTKPSPASTEAAAAATAEAEATAEASFEKKYATKFNSILAEADKLDKQFKDLMPRMENRKLEKSEAEAALAVIVPFLNEANDLGFEIIRFEEKLRLLIDKTINLTRLENKINLYINRSNDSGNDVKIAPAGQAAGTGAPAASASADTKELDRVKAKYVTNYTSYLRDHDVSAKDIVLKKLDNGVFEVDLGTNGANNGKFLNPELAIDAEGNVIINYMSYFDEDTNKYMDSKLLEENNLVERKEDGKFHFYDKTTNEEISTFDAFSKINMNHELSSKHFNARLKPEEKQDIANLLQQKGYILTGIDDMYKSLGGAIATGVRALDYLDISIYDSNEKKMKTFEIKCTNGKISLEDLKNCINKPVEYGAHKKAGQPSAAPAGPVDQTGGSTQNKSEIMANKEIIYNNNKDLLTKAGITFTERADTPDTVYVTLKGSVTDNFNVSVASINNKSEEKDAEFESLNARILGGTQISAGHETKKIEVVEENGVIKLYNYETADDGKQTIGILKFEPKKSAAPADTKTNTETAVAATNVKVDDGKTTVTNVNTGEQAVATSEGVTVQRISKLQTLNTIWWNRAGYPDLSSFNMEIGKENDEKYIILNQKDNKIKYNITQNKYTVIQGSTEKPGGKEEIALIKAKSKEAYEANKSSQIMRLIYEIMVSE